MKKIFSALEPRSVLRFFVTLDFLVILLHLIIGRFFLFWHLDYEANFPTVYQSSKLIIFGFLLLLGSLFWRSKERTRFFVLPLSFAMVALGFDELFQIHENIYRVFSLFSWLHPNQVVTVSLQMGYRSSLWILYYVPLILLFILWIGYWLRVFQTTLRENFQVIIVSILCIFVALITEVLGSSGLYSQGVYFALITLEESAEMFLATSFVFVGLQVLLSPSKSKF